MCSSSPAPAPRNLVTNGIVGTGTPTGYGATNPVMPDTIAAIPGDPKGNNPTLTTNSIVMPGAESNPIPAGFQSVAPNEAPIASPIPTMSDPNPTETAAMKRKRLALLRGGLASTIKTSPLGLAGSASGSAPTASAPGMMAGIKTKLGL